ncbi:thymidylate kinase [Leptolyngbyaceae cyanobacterium JSC-12]|nr:thymidylate kinase [Leptolyngbyaceae cyanobacterium JSC-12]
MRGRFIVFEGGEGSGKTTQLERSRQWLITSGWLEYLQAKDYIRDLVITREPGGTDIGQAIRTLLLNHISQEPIQDRAELLLYAADRAQHVEGFLRPHLEAGALILCDRYTDSTIAYQGYGRGLDLTLIHQLNQIASGGLESDLTLWLDLSAQAGLARTQQRGTRDRIEQADLTFHQKVHKGFAQLAQQYPQRIVRIDASQSEDAVAQQLQAALIQAFTRWF